jgi:hypothetical protein
MNGNLPYGTSTDDYGGRPVSIEEARLSNLGNQLKANPALRHILDADPEHNRRALELVKACPVLITFREFQLLMKQRNHDVDELVNTFAGKIDEPRKFFERVMSCEWRNPDTGRLEDRGDVVIPYKSVVKFYQEELHYFKDTAKKSQRLCQCGCGKPVFGQYRFASESCRKRLQRSKVLVPA